MRLTTRRVWLGKLASRLSHLCRATNMCNLTYDSSDRKVRSQIITSENFPRPQNVFGASPSQSWASYSMQRKGRGFNSTLYTGLERDSSVLQSKNLYRWLRGWCLAGEGVQSKGFLYMTSFPTIVSSTHFSLLLRTVIANPFQIFI